MRSALDISPNLAGRANSFVPRTEALKHTAEFGDEWQLVYSHDRNWCRRL
jgi:hypothetical protein